MKKCPFCESQIQDEVTFCEFCGKKVSQPTPQTAPRQPAQPAVQPAPQQSPPQAVQPVPQQTVPQAAQPQSQPAVQPKQQSAPQNNYTIIDQIGDRAASASILQWNSLTGSSNIANARMIYDAEKVGMKLRQVVLSINNSSVILEPGALHFMKGDISIRVNSGGLAGYMKKSLTASLTNETVHRPEYTGSGVIYLEPSFGHYLLVQIDEDTVVDKGIFYAAQNTIEVGFEMQRNLSAGMAGGEGWFQTKLIGRGWAVLTSPVPASEIMKIRLNNEKLSVDGNFAMLRKGNIDFRVERSVKGIFGSHKSGEGLLQTFSGSGEVWLAPTQGIYERAGGFNALSHLSNPDQKSSGATIKLNPFRR